MQMERSAIAKKTISRKTRGGARPQKTNRSEHTAAVYQRVRGTPSHLIHPADLRVLQRTIGNHAVGKLLQAKMAEQTALQRQDVPCPGCPDKEEEEMQPKLQRQTAPEEEEEMQPKLQRQAAPEEEEEMQPKLQRQTAPEEEEEMQPKMSVGAPNDIYEQEADQGADRVVSRMQQVRCPNEQNERPVSIQRNALYDTPPISRISLKPAGAIGSEETAGQGVEESINKLRGKGSLLPETVQTKMETAFGADFSAVRVHTGEKPAQLNRNVKAKAFTVGNDIFFNDGQYSPHTRGGRHLLAHELTHTIQQGGTSAEVQRTVGDGHDLRSPRFAGILHLEMAFDNETLIRNGRRGEAVRRIQEALLEMGYRLPRYGADGIFGNETRDAIIAFQKDAGALKIDGIVGPETMGLLDDKDTGPVEPPPVVAGYIPGIFAGGTRKSIGDAPENTIPDRVPEHRPQRAGTVPAVSDFKLVTGHRNDPATEPKNDRGSGTFAMSFRQPGGRHVSPFGSEFYEPEFKNITWYLHNNTCKITSDLKINCPWGTASGGATDVPSATSPVVTKRNWRRIRRDLMPAAASPHKSPRTSFYSKKLVERHEKFHGKDDWSWSRATGIGLVRRKISATDINVSNQRRTDREVRTLLNQCLVELKAENIKWYKGSGTSHDTYDGEIRAYADGKPHYEALARAVAAHGRTL